MTPAFATADPPRPSERGSEALLAWLAGLDRDDQPQASPREVAEMLWLARRLPVAGARPVLLVPSQGRRGLAEDAPLGRAGSVPQSDGVVPPPPPAEPPSAPLGGSPFFPEAVDHAPAAQREAQLLPERVLPRQHELRLRLGLPRLLPADRLVQAALDPLFLLAPLPGPPLLDEQATLDRSAEAGWLQPVFRPRLQPRFSLTLLVDQGQAMQLWQPLANDFYRILVNTRAFRDVRRIDLSPQKTAEQLKASLPNNGDRDAVLLLLSDTAGPHWWDGRMLLALQDWRRQRPIAVLHLLPAALIRRTALRLLAWASIRNAWPAAPATRYQARELDGWEQALCPEGAIPVVPLDPAELAPWAKMAMGQQQDRLTGVILPTAEVAAEAEADLQQQGQANSIAAEDDLPALQRWQRFCEGASPPAQRLLRLLAAAPVLTLPVMQLLKETLLPGASTGPLPLVEALASGLLKPLAFSQHEQDPDAVQYEVVAGLGDLLRDDLTDRDTVDVVRAVSDLLEQRWNSLSTGHSFLAAVTDPQVLADLRRREPKLADGLVNFATLTADRIARIPGQAFQLLADQLRQQQQPQPIWPDAFQFVLTDEFDVALNLLIPTIQDIRFERGSLLEIELQEISFATARLLAPKLASWCFQEPLSASPGSGEVLALAAEAVCLTMIQVPAGGFSMGAAPREAEQRGSEGPQHEVQLQGFFLSQTPITQAQWRQVAGWREREGERWERELDPEPSFFQPRSNPKARSYFEGRFSLLQGESNSDQRPVENVSWLEALEFCNRLSQRTGRHYTLPSEAQWEYACRAGTTTPFACGATLSAELANYDATYTYGDGPQGEYRRQTTPVGMFPANAWGLQDMHGNVWEWCLDDWHDSYEGAPADGSAWLDVLSLADKDKPQKTKLLRGGSWNNHPRNCRSAYRGRNQPDDASNNVGFRVVCLPQGCFS